MHNIIQLNILQAPILERNARNLKPEIFFKKSLHKKIVKLTNQPKSLNSF